MNFCSTCGATRQPAGQFCTQCGAAFDAGAAQPAILRPNPAAGLAVFGLLALVGVGLWVRILEPRARLGPPGSPTTGGGATAAAAGVPALPEGHPPIDRLQLTDDVKTFIANLVTETEKQPENAAAWQRLAEVQYRAARVDPTYYQGALASYRHLLKIEPEHAAGLRGLADTHYDLREYREALPLYEKYLVLHPEDASAQTDLATVRLHLGEVDQAIAEYRKIIAANPTFAEPYYNLGVALRQAGDDQGAREALQRAKELAANGRLRLQVDQLLARLGAAPAGAAGAQTPPVASPASGSAAAASAPPSDGTPGRPAATAFQGAIEGFFRGHELLGPKIVAVNWPGPTSASVVIRDFPMNEMPPFAREKFIERIREAVRQAKTAGELGGSAEVAIVDSATRTVMETVTE